MIQRLQQLTRKPILIIAIGGLLIFALAVSYFAPHPQPPLLVETATVTDVAPAVEVLAAVPLITPDKATTVLELFNPSDQYLTHQLNETSVTQQIEQIMATSYVLANCKLISTSDYRDTFRAAIVYTQHMKLAADATAAEATVRQIAQSASASYSLVYSRAKCDSPQLQSIKQQLLDWQAAYLNE